jgi:hypothetical protein
VARFCDRFGGHGNFPSLQAAGYDVGKHQAYQRHHFYRFHLPDKHWLDDKLPHHGLHGMEAIDLVPQVKMVNPFLVFL